MAHKITDLPIAKGLKTFIEVFRSVPSPESLSTNDLEDMHALLQVLLNDVVSLDATVVAEQSRRQQS